MKILLDKIRRRIALLEARWKHEVIRPRYGADEVDRRLRSDLRGRFGEAGYYSRLFERWLSESPEGLRDFEAPGASRSGRHNILEHKLDLFGVELDCPSDVDWHRDPVHGVRWPKRYVATLSLERRGSDATLLWQLNKMLFLLDASRLYRTTGDESYARIWAGWVRGWIDRNPYMIGMNWRSPMEAGTRLVAWSIGMRELAGSDFLTEELLADILPSLIRQAEFVSTDFSFRDVSNNHLVGEAATLYAFSVMWPVLEKSREWREKSEKILATEIERQVLPDGMDFENAFNYHAFVLDFYLLYLYAKCLEGRVPDHRLLGIVERMVDVYLLAISPSGRLARFGDDSCIDFFLLKPPRELETIEFSDSVKMRDLLHPEFAGVLERCAWGASLLERNMPLDATRHLDASGFAIFRSTGSQLVYASGPTHNGTFAAGHVHADATSFELEVGGVPLFIDSGTYLYGYDADTRSHFKGGRAHNTLLIDGVEPMKSLEPFKWRSVPRGHTTWRSTSQPCRGVASSRALPSATEEYRHERIVVQIRDSTWVVADRLHAAAGENVIEDAETMHDVSVLFHTPLSSDRFEVIDTTRTRIQLPAGGHPPTEAADDESNDYVLAAVSSSDYRCEVIADPSDERTWYSRWYGDLQNGTTLCGRARLRRELVLAHTLSADRQPVRLRMAGPRGVELVIGAGGDADTLFLRFDPTIVELNGEPIGKSSTDG